jgi:hypothetical protein
MHTRRSSSLIGVCRVKIGVCIIIIGVVSVVRQYNCVQLCLLL